MEQELRSLTNEQSQLRFNAESRTIEGYAMVFNSRSNLLFGKFYEQIKPDAMKGVIEKSDVLALLDHQRNRGVLARSKMGKGTLTMQVDEIGVRVLFTPPKTSLGDEAIEYLQRGEIEGMSYHFTPGVKDKWAKRSDGYYDRTILSFDKLMDVSLVFTPAYPETSAALRSLEQFLGVKDPLSLDQLAEKYSKMQEQLNKFKT